MRCKSLLLATVSSLAIIGAVNVAAAADLPARVMPVKAPVVAAAYNWTGFYIGVHGGGAWLDHKQSTTEGGDPGCGVVVPGCSFDKFGGAFGGLAGYNFQAGQVVYGIEVDGTWLSTKGSKTFANTPITQGQVTIHGKVDWLATIRGRLGVTVTPATLLYVTGGAAFGGVNSGWNDVIVPPDTVTIDKTKVGWVAGAGIEFAFASNWLVRVEGLYHDLGKDTASNSVNGGTYSTTFHHRVTTARAALALRW